MTYFACFTQVVVVGKPGPNVAVIVFYEGQGSRWQETKASTQSKQSFPVFTRASLVAQTVKYLPAMWETGVQSLGQEDSWRRKWQPTPVSLPGESHGWRSLVGYSPRGSQRVRHD